MDPTEPSPLTDLTGQRILVVDNDRLSRETLDAMLQPKGCTLAEADSGERALAVYPEFKPDLVLLSVAMPGLDGFETSRRLRRSFGADCAPIIFLTAPDGATAGDGNPAIDGADFLRKPFQSDEVVTRIRIRRHILQLEAQHQALTEQLSTARTAENRLLGMAAHDLRNPLGSIRSLATFLRDGTVGELTADQLELVETIHSTSQSMLSLVSDLLDVATIKAGKLKIMPELHSLDELVGDSVYLAKIAAAPKKIDVALAATPATPAIAIDAAKIKQVVDNLLSNAVKYSPPGSTITVVLHAGDHKCSLSVKDQGPGIPEHERSKLFQDFGRLSVRPTGGELSTGLGLAICWKIVEAHHGTIVAENLPGGGCEFRVTLPLPT